MDELLKCLVPNPLKNFIILHVQEHSHKPSSPVSQPFTQIMQSGCSTNACINYKWFDINTTTCYPCYPFEYVSLQANTLFSTQLSSRYKPLTHPVDHPKRKKIFRLSIQAGSHLLSRNPPQKCLIANLPKLLYLLDSKTITYLKNHLNHSNNLQQQKPD